MEDFARNTGLTSEVPPRRYLWTDGFAVCNFLELYRRTSEEMYLDHARDLVHQVHDVLGQHRKDDHRSGWISGLPEEEGRQHPTRGGLRIGKPLNERKPTEPYDVTREWRRDGQYFHYLTKWMHALNRVYQVTGDSTYLRWARELAQAAYRGFVYAVSPSGKKRMHWKMSIDLSYPLIDTMGQHDPLDGFVVYNELQANATQNEGPDLRSAITDFEAMCEASQFATGDPLGIGSLLTDAYRISELVANGYLERADFLESLLDDAEWSLESFTHSGETQADVLSKAATSRLAFRELGLSIGLRAIEGMRARMARDPGRLGGRPVIQSHVESLIQHSGLKQKIESFWLEPKHRQADSWLEHSDINTVMLATSLVPEGYLAMAEPENVTRSQGM